MTAAEEGALGLVVPVFDEAARVEEFVADLVAFIEERPTGSELVFVDDGSADGTPDRIEGLVGPHSGRVRILRRPHQGKGAAVTAGLLSTTTPVRAFCDLDLATPLEDLLRIVAVGSRPGALAIGSRDLAGSAVVRPQSPVRETLGRGYNRLLQVLLTPGIVDTQCGAKAATAPVWEALLAHAREPGFAWDAEVVALAEVVGVAVTEVPVTWHHDPRSKVHVLRDGLQMVAATPSIWRRRRAVSRRQTVGGAEVFGDANAARLIATDRSHWWFRGKAALVSTALRRTTGAHHNQGRLVDAGGGAGGVTAMLGWSSTDVTVVEGSDLLVREAVDRHGFDGIRGSVTALPLAAGSVTVLCLLDVIEHLEDPVSALRQARGALEPGGRLVVNVPAHQFLWSAADVELGHQRRYTTRLLRQHLAAAGLQPILLTHVFSWLVPPVWLARRLVRPSEPSLGLDQTSPVVDRVAMVLTWCERQLLGHVNLPLGTSILCVALSSTDPPP